MEQTDTALETAKVNVQIFTKTIEETKRKSPELAHLLDPMAEQAKEIKAAINQGLKYKKQLEEEKKRQENFTQVRTALEEWINLHEADIREKPYLISRNGKNYTLNEILHEIRMQTNIGKEIEKNIIMLTIDLLARNKERL